MYLLTKPTLTNFNRTKVKSHIRRGKKGTYVVKEFDRKDRRKKLIQNIAKAAIVTGIVGAVSMTHPAIRNKVFSKKTNLDLEEALYKLDMNPNSKKVISNFRNQIKSFIPFTTNSKNYKIDLNENNIKKELLKWRLDLEKIPKNTRDNKYDIQKEMFDQVLNMDFNKAPDIFPVAYKDKKGILKGFSILRPNLEYDALEISNFAIKDGENTLLRDLLKTNISISEKLGFKGKIYGSDASSYAEKLYIRLGSKKIDDGYIYIPKQK